MNLKFQTSDIEKGKKWVAAQAIRHVNFSNRTYQVEVQGEEEEETTWVFIQLSKQGGIQDQFCTCLKAERFQSCPHLAAGALFILSEAKPFHKRYEESLVYRLFFLAARRYGFSQEIFTSMDSDQLIIEEGQPSSSFSLRLLTSTAKEKLKEIFEKPKETEENSIKFSNLDSEEMKLYREGAPSFSLQFELSFWSDFSKWIFFRETIETFLKVKLIEDEEGVPKFIELNTEDIELKIYLTKVNWQEVLDPLKAYFAVHDFITFDLEKISFDSTRACFVLHKKPALIQNFMGLIELEGCSYLPGQGFFPKQDDPLFLSDEIPHDEVLFFIKKYRALLDKYFDDLPFIKEKKKASYALFFDQDNFFHIELYLDHPFDLNEKNNPVFLPYLYRKGVGFIKLTDLLFDSSKKVIPPQKMGRFIEQFKHWLNVHDGFQIHLNSLEASLGFKMQADLTLQFFSQEQLQSGGDLIDLDEWCFLKGYGFFPKTSTRSNSKIKPGTRIEKEAIGSFIEQNLVELELIHGFFLPVSPIKQVGLKAVINAEQFIEISPKIELVDPDYEGKVIVFGGYGYVRNKGFFPLKEGFHLPRGYEEKKVIPRYLEEQFYRFEWNQIEKYVIECDVRLKKADRDGFFIVQKAEEDAGKKITLQIDYETDLGKVPLTTLIEAKLASQENIPSEAGLIFLDERRWEFLSLFSKKNLSKENGKVKISFLEWIKIIAFIQPKFSSQIHPSTVSKLKDIEALAAFEGQELPNLSGFLSQLRPYQKIGLRWLWHLYHYELSGILADDMGLGKTHQAMAILAAVFNAHQERKSYLVVCPTSVIYHWENLLKTFLPQFRVKLFYGPMRKLEGFSEQFDLLLTSYGTLRSDTKELAKLRFEIAIYDEMHVAKNQQSQIHKSLKKIGSKMKIGLTGTPIENDLFELKALFDLILPHYFPDATTFKEEFIYPIEKFDDQERKNRLKKLIAPFVLRRKKTEVLADLPEKIEEIAYVDLSDEQRVLYRKIVEEKKLNPDETEDENSFYFHVFQLFNKLKQLCNHPALVLQDIANYQKYQSGKFELFKELLEEARQSKQKVVVFSQYLGMLEIFRLYLNEQKIGYAGIQGDTRDRREQIERFKEDPECVVFLASLQAAGVGIDLVSASIVIHYDRWWNPAKENQATDRVHRIGQTRGVQVFKIVSKETIEEHIHEMILKKLYLAQSIIGYDEEFEMKKIDRKELMNLLKLVKTD